jgi:hypothetical protein
MAAFDNIMGATSKRQLSANESSVLLYPQVNSATAYLFKKAVSGIPRVANLLWGIIQEYAWDEDIIGIIEGMHVQALTDIGVATNIMLHSALSPYFQSILNTLQSINDIGDYYSHATTCTQDNEAPSVTSAVSDTSSCDQNMETSEGGLMLQNIDFDKRNESNERLDYIITQVDISRMARAASRHLDVESIDQLPTLIYRTKNTSICSSHEDEDVDEFLLRNAHIIEDYFDNSEGNTGLNNQKEDLLNGPSQFSWMVVPGDPKEDNVTRISNSVEIEVPDSISICNSATSLKMEYDKHDAESFDFCAICEEPFQDGESLRVLPCQHLFHCGCIDKWLSGEKKCIISGCAMCKKAQQKALFQQEEVPESRTQDPQCKSYQLDGSVCDESSLNWAFARLGKLLSGLSNESPSSD